MTLLGIQEKRSNNNTILVGVGFDGHAKELLDWALVKVAQPGDSVVALHVCRNSDSSSKAKVLMDDYLDDYQGICHQKQVGIAVEVVKGSSIRKLLVREAKNRAAAAVIVGINRNSPLGYTGRVSIAKYCAKKLALTTQVMAVHNGKIIYQNSPKDPNFCKDYHSEFGDSEISISISSDFGGRISLSSKDEPLDSNPFQRRRTLSGISLPVEEFTQQKPGWPLLQTSSEMTQVSKEARRMSVVQWVMNLPSRSRLEIPQNFRFCADVSSDLEHLLKVVESKGCKLFSYDTLRSSTSQFCSDNLIGKGGCNSVYKGILPDEKPVAIKVMQSSKKAWKEFTLEIDIMTTLMHKNITRLLGICLADDHLISVHDFLPKGSLEDNLHGNDQNKDDDKFNSCVLGWEVRYNIAIGIAEGLNYLHNECPRPVIHRDVKSSNILLNDEFEPKLSDFGLSIWGPKQTTEEASSYYFMDSDVVGTFGYLAPEYFMYGKVSHKVDVYSYGVVLLELLSGRRAIGFEKSKGKEESLVIWAKPKLDRGDINGILDPGLGKNVDDVQVQRMVCAAKLCLTQSARRRPNINQVLKMLRGEEEYEQSEEVSRGNKAGEHKDNENGEIDDDDELMYLDSSTAESHLSTALSDVLDNSASFSSQDQSSPLSVEEYLRRRWSRSSSNLID